MSTNLTYSIAQELLYGTVNGKTFAVPAFSGGGRGATTAGVAQASLVSYSPFRKMQGTTRGGAIPPGKWRVLVPRVSGDSKGPWVSVLMPEAGTRDAFPQRDYDIERFKIHGTGPKGSDGCIVIAPQHRIPILKAVKAAGGATLTVMWHGATLMDKLELSLKQGKKA